MVTMSYIDIVKYFFGGEKLRIYHREHGVSRWRKRRFFTTNRREPTRTCHSFNQSTKQSILSYFIFSLLKI